MQEKANDVNEDKGKDKVDTESGVGMSTQNE